MMSTQIVDPLKDPPCPECGCMMWIKSIEPDKPHHERRTYECPRCLYVESLVLEIH
jgi:DNA-directed RNA polymerase subunit M/transcription elongation factor TFIIS